MQRLGTNRHPVTEMSAVAHSRQCLLEVWLEPWGDHVFLLPGISYRFVTSLPKRSDVEPPLLFDYGDNDLTVWVSGATIELRVSREGSLIWDSDIASDNGITPLRDPGLLSALLAIESKKKGVPRYSGQRRV